MSNAVAERPAVKTPWIKNLGDVPAHLTYEMCIRDSQYGHDNGDQNTAVDLGIGEDGVKAPVSYTHLDVYKRQIKYLIQ